MALARLEQAVYCGKQRFNQWDVGTQVYAVDESKAGSEMLYLLGNLSGPRGLIFRLLRKQQPNSGWNPQDAPYHIY